MRTIFSGLGLLVAILNAIIPVVPSPWDKGIEFLLAIISVYFLKKSGQVVKKLFKK
jgi:hypothetical protein